MARIAALEDLCKEAWLRERNGNHIVWKTKDGKVIPIKDMTDEHLVNTILMLQKKEDMEELACEYEAYMWEKI